MNASRSIPRRLGPAVAAFLVGLAAAATAWVRLGPDARQTAWGEDGGFFLTERLQYGVDGTLLRPYAGYLHLLPRLVVDLGVARPIDQYALTVSVACCLVVGAACAAVFVLAREAVPSWPMRLLLAAVPVVLPIAPWEVLGNAANLHWTMLFLAPWLFAFRPRSWWSAALVAAVAVPVVLTELQTVLFLPLLVLAWWPRGDERRLRDRLRALPLTVVVLVCSSAQLVAATTPRASDRGRLVPADAAAGYLLKVVGGAWTDAIGAIGRVAGSSGWVVLAVPLALAVLVVVTGFVLAPTWRIRVLLAATALASPVVWCAALAANRSADGAWAHLDAAHLAAETASRYATSAAAFLTAALVVAASVLVGASRSARSGGTARLVGVGSGWVVVAVVVAAAVGSFAGSPTTRDGTPSWRTQVQAARSTCAAHPGRTVTIRFAPWDRELPCSLVLRDR